MRDGAVGFSTGLQYVPGTYADTDEIVALAKVAAKLGRRLRHAHAQRRHRARSGGGRSARHRRRPGIAVQMSHLKVDAPSRWGASAKALAMIDAARASGLQVLADQYLYDAASSNLGIRFPSWALEGGQATINTRLDDAATWARIKEEMRKLIRERGLENYTFARIANYPADPPLNGLTIPEAAQKVKGSKRPRRAVRDDAAHAARRRRVDGLSVHVRGRHHAHPEAPDGVDRQRQRPQHDRRGRAASARLRQRRAGAGRATCASGRSSRSKRPCAR